MIEHFTYQTPANSLRHTTSPPALLKLFFFFEMLKRKNFSGHSARAKKSL